MTDVYDLDISVACHKLMDIAEGLPTLERLKIMEQISIIHDALAIKNGLDPRCTYNQIKRQIERLENA